MRIAAASLLALISPLIHAGTAAFTITDDAELTAAVAEVREQFLATAPFERLNVCLLLPNADGTWRRGQVNGDELSYPASSVKLAYLAAALHWCRENGHPYNFLDEAVRPMIVVSDNPATGRVVDAITGAPNIANPASDEQAAFEQARLYTERFLDSRGLLGDQRISAKTYPSNTSDGPEGAEQLMLSHHGRNAMCPNLAAELMLEIAHAAIEPEGNAYALDLLSSHGRWTDHTPIGFGVPPGSIIRNKGGWAYHDLNDIAQVILPNGREFILAVFSDGYQQETQPSPWANATLGDFVDALIDRVGLREGCPPRVIVDDASAEFAGQQLSYMAGWMPSINRGEPSARWNGGFHQSLPSGRYNPPAINTATWHLQVPESGRYEVCVRYPQIGGQWPARDAVFHVRHADGETAVPVNQQIAGGRWIRLGDFRIDQGAGEVVLTNEVSTELRVPVPSSAEGFEDETVAISDYGIGMPHSGPYVIADAVMATRWPDLSPTAGTDVIVDNDHTPPHYTETGTDWGTSPSQGHDNHTYRYAHTGTASTATWTAPLTEAGEYAVSTHFRAGGNRAAQAVFYVEAVDGSHEVTIDQTSAVTGGELVWRELGTHRFAAGDARVTLTAQESSGGDVVIGDAVRFERVGD